jgi:Ca2+-binding RTX toxin-like protein
MSGYSVSSAGDVNGDGLDDIVMGAPGEATKGEMSGSSFVVFGKTDTEAVELSAIQARASEIPAGFIINGANISDSAGQSSVSNAGDVNGDGLDDLIIGAIGGDPNGTGSGVTYVVFGKQSDQSVELSMVQNGIGGFSINGAQKNDNSGWSVSGAGDLNGDSFADILVGVPFASPNGKSSGSSYAIFGGNITKSVTQVGTTDDETLTGTHDNDIIFSGLGNDTIIGSPGIDRIAGGGGADIFVLSREDGLSTVIDFSPTEGDKVDITNFGFANWADMQPYFSPSVGNNTKLTLDFDTILFFDNIAYDEFEEVNFII